jgi:hypothetical protein
VVEGTTPPAMDAAAASDETDAWGRDGASRGHELDRKRRRAELKGNIEHGT